MDSGLAQFLRGKNAKVRRMAGQHNQDPDRYTLQLPIRTSGKKKIAPDGGIHLV